MQNHDTALGETTERMSDISVDLKGLVQSVYENQVKLVLDNLEEHIGCKMQYARNARCGINPKLPFALYTIEILAS